MARREDILPQARALGIHSIGIATAEPVDPAAWEQWTSATSSPQYDGIAYLRRYDDIRRDPRLLLPGARSIIIAAISYFTEPKAPAIAMYAQGSDYHEILRQRLDQLAQTIKEHFGGDTRVFVDTAPILERYWARKAGIGFVGRNSQLIVPGAGSRFFLGGIVTTAPFEPTTPSTGACCGCNRCVKACPGGAIGADGSFNPAKCLSYLTIEHRGDLPDGTNLAGRLYGCDICQDICPHNAASPATPIEEFHTREAYLHLDIKYIAERMTPEEFSHLFRNTPIKRAKLAGLRRNALHLLTHSLRPPKAQ